MVNFTVCLFVAVQTRICVAFLNKSLVAHLKDLTIIVFSFQLWYRQVIFFIVYHKYVCSIIIVTFIYTLNLG